MATEMATGLVTRTYGEARSIKEPQTGAGSPPSSGLHAIGRTTTSHRLRTRMRRRLPATLLTRGLIKRKARTNEPSCSPGVAMSCRSELPASASGLPAGSKPSNRTSAHRPTTPNAAAVRWIVDAIGG